MSVEAMSTCWGPVPWSHGCQLVAPHTVRIVALAIADVVNDMHNNEFFASFSRLADKLDLHRDTVRRVVRHLTENGVLDELEPGRPGCESPGRYRWTWWPKLSTDGVEGSRIFHDRSRNVPRGGSRTAPRQNASNNPTDVRRLEAFCCGQDCPHCGGEQWVEVGERTMAPCPRRRPGRS